jgi:glycosyltransferase involved in cell wall biosynthesis
MKILYLSWFNSGEGSQIHANEFMNAMKSIGHDVIPVELSLKTKKQLQNLKIQTTSYKKSKIAFFQEFKTFLLNILRVIRLLRLNKHHKPEVIINRYLIYDFSAIIAGKLLRIPVVYEVNASAVYEREIQGRYFIKPLARWTEKLIFRHADVVTVVSKELKTYFQENNYNTDNTIVIPNGVNISHHNEGIKVPESLLELNQKWENNTVLGFLGSLKSWHGVERVINLIPSLIKQNPNIRFLIVGDGNERVALENKIKQLDINDYVHITGFLPHDFVPGALSLFDIALAPYKDIDNFYFSPLKIFEYMAAGKPVIAPALGQIKDLVETNKTGILLKENSQHALEEAILTLSSNQKRINELGTEAKKFIEQNYTWEINAQKIASSIQKLQK